MIKGLRWDEMRWDDCFSRVLLSNPDQFCSKPYYNLISKTIDILKMRLFFLAVSVKRFSVAQV